MTNIEVNEETQKLLKQKGLKCICQLCDCGRWHKHMGCKIPHNAVFPSTNRSHDWKIQSDYQARFTDNAPQPRVKPIYPEEVRKNPFPPAMDLQTVKQLSYQKFQNSETRKPCKLEGEIKKFMSGDFSDKTNYNDTFTAFKGKPAKIARPPTVLKASKTTFASESEYRNGFQKKEKLPEKAFPEKPSYTYDLLYPNEISLPSKSVTNSDHQGLKGEKAKMCALRKSNIEIGVEGEFDHTTTHGIHFQAVGTPERTNPIKRSCAERLPSSKFESISQKQKDFRYDESEARSARAKLITEHPSLIKLGMDIPSDFDTVASLSYHKWQPDQFRKPAASSKPSSKYSPPKEKFDAKPVSHTDFKNHGIRPRTDMYHPPEFQKSNAKVSGESSYSASFKNHGKVERQFFGEYLSPNLKLPPPEKRFQATSVMKNDFRTNKVEKRPMFKQSQAYSPSNEKIQDATEYNERFLPKESKACTFSKYLALAQPRKEFECKDEIIT